MAFNTKPAFTLRDIQGPTLYLYTNWKKVNTELEALDNTMAGVAINSKSRTGQSTHFNHTLYEKQLVVAKSHTTEFGYL